MNHCEAVAARRTATKRAKPLRNPSPLWGGSAERSGGRGGGAESPSLPPRPQPDPASPCGYHSRCKASAFLVLSTAARRPPLATLPTRGRDKRSACGALIIQLSNSPRAELQARVIAPCSVRPQGAPVLKLKCLPHFPERGVRNDRAFHRARGATWVNTWHHAPFQAHDTVYWWNSTQQGCLAAADANAARTPAFRTRRFYRLATPSGATAPGALTECWASPHCWVLGPPTSSAGRRPFTTSRLARLNRRAAHAKGPQTRRVRRIPLLRR
jgi:hypothetical protein